MRLLSLALGGLPGVQAQLGNLAPVARGNVRLGADPAAAHGVDEGGVDVLSDVVAVHAAGGQELHAHKGSGQILHGLQAAVNIGREELDHFQAVFHGAHDLGGGDAAGGDGDAVLHAVAHHLFAEAGGDDELP